MLAQRRGPSNSRLCHGLFSLPTTRLLFSPLEVFSAVPSRPESKICTASPFRAHDFSRTTTALDQCSAVMKSLTPLACNICYRRCQKAAILSPPRFTAVLNGFALPLAICLLALFNLICSGRGSWQEHLASDDDFWTILDDLGFMPTRPPQVRIARGDMKSSFLSRVSRPSCDGLESSLHVLICGTLSLHSTSILDLASLRRLIPRLQFSGLSLL
jgi:hypothetical protein